MAKKTVKKATKEPKGSITRDKLKFTAAWKIADADYKDGQQWTRKISYAVATTEANAVGASLTFTEAGGDEITEPLGTSVTSKVIKVEAKDYYPNTNKRLKKISVKVKGKRKGHENSKTKYVYTWSKWSEFVFAINAPKNPIFSAKPAELYQDDDRRSHFIVSATSVDDKNHTPVSRLQWESILVKNSSTTDGSKQKWDKTVTGWKTGTTSTLSNYEVPIPTETIVPTDTDSWTRFVRVRAQGIGGDSAWVYNYHVYGKAYTPQVTEGDVGVGDGTLIIDADWTTPSDPSHPVDKITLQYCITEPAAGLTCPVSASWTDAQVTGDTKAIDKAFYEVGQGLEDDQCLFYRVTAVHDNETSHSDPVLKYVGYLKQPTGLSVQINWQTKRATVTATNASGVADSFLAIYTNIGGYHCIGYIPHGQTSATVEIPDFANENNFAIGVRAVVGMWQNGLKPYSGKPLMQSQNTLWQGGSVPKAPTNVTVEKTSVSGTVSVSWDWAWEDADSAQIAWSDNPLAWESTDEPSDYTITNLNPSRWYVAELATGQIWYFRVRLLQTNDDSITYGAWSDMASINLSSAPNRPTLFLSDGVISADSMTKAYWAYVSTDTTPQAYAEICEATIDGGGITYGEPILHTQSEQHIDIYPNELGWAEGETHYLCVRVTSASGIPSEGWSEPVPLQIAAEMTCEITDTSLVKRNVEVNPITIEGNPVEFDNDEGNLEFAKLRVDLEPTQEGTGDPSPTNVRPIHGVGEVEFEDVADEQYDFSKVVIGKNWIDGNDATRAVLKFSAKPNTKYNVVAKGGNFAMILFIQMNGYSQITNQGIFPYDGTITTQGNCDTVIIQWQKSSAITAADFNGFECSINEGEISITEPLTTTLQPIASDDEPYLMRAMPYSDATNLTENLVGGTVAWNQLVNGDFSGSSWSAQGAFTLSVSNKVATLKVNDDITSIWYGLTHPALNLETNHKVLLTVDALAPINGIGIGCTGTSPAGGTNRIWQGIANSWTKISIITNVTGGETIRPQAYAGSNCANLNVDDEIKLKNFMTIDLTAMFGSTIADYIYNLEQSSAGAGVAWFKKLFPKPYYAYNAGELMSVNTSAHNTVGFNAWDEEWELGWIHIDGSNRTASDIIRSKNYIPVIPNTQYYFNVPDSTDIIYFDSDKTAIGNIDKNNQGDISATSRIRTTHDNCHYIRFWTRNQTTYNHDICINISDPDKNGTYKPFNGHTYPLPNTELRGIPKWVNGKLSYDGDILEPSGRVTRKFIEVDLSELTWQTRVTGTTNKFMRSTLPSSYTGYPKTGFAALSERYSVVDGVAGTSNLNDPDSKSVGIYWYSNSGNPQDVDLYLICPINDTPSGKMVYEKASTSTETVSSFESNQLVSKGGTESYTDTRTVPIPVGHKSTYKTSHVYGGYVDLVSGELVVDRAVVDLGTLNWAYYSDYQMFYANVVGKKAGLDNLLCSKYRTTDEIFTVSNDKAVGGNGSNSTSYVRDSSFNQDAASFKTAMNGVTLVYELVTPQTYQLTSRQIDALLGHNTVTTDNGTLTVRVAEGVEEVDCLTKLPLTVTVTGAGDGGTTILAIERDGDYPMRRPDETEYTGHDGETIALLTQSGEDEMTVDLPSLIGYLDDGARYRIVATTKDAFGQTATDSLDFLVKWDEQAIVPDGAVEIDGTIAKLTPIAPSGVTDGACCDIYRLSADRPELVYPNAEFGETYVDPYPAIGGGYRFVYKTKYGDYITENDALAWLDIESEFEHDRMIVDFGGDSAELYYNVDEDDDWSKDFQSTQYLGGHIVGDWNPAVERTADISAVVITIIEEDTVDALRRLADYAGAVHVRTLSGSSYTANVDVKRSKSHDHFGTRYSYGLKISKVDSQGYDGMPEDLYEVIS